MECLSPGSPRQDAGRLPARNRHAGGQSRSPPAKVRCLKGPFFAAWQAAGVELSGGRAEKPQGEDQALVGVHAASSGQHSFFSLPPKGLGSGEQGAVFQVR